MAESTAAVTENLYVWTTAFMIQVLVIKLYELVTLRRSDLSINASHAK